MKKHVLNISTVSILSVLCAGAISSDALAAASVRSLGGVGTVNGTAAASTSTRVTSSSRAGSLRVTPSSARVISTTNATKPATGSSTSGTSVSSGQRLSIGKYLGGATTASGTNTVATTAGLNDDVDDLDRRVDALENAMGSPDVSGGKTLDNRISALEDAQAAQPTYSTNGTVIVENGEVTINMDELKKEFFGANDGIAMEYDEATQSIRWGIPDQNGDVADDDWHTLVNTTALSGEYATADDLETAITSLATVYLSKADAAATYQTIANLTQTISAESTTAQYPSAKAVYDVTKDLAVASNVYTKEEVNTKISAVTGDAGSISEQLSGAIGALGDDGNGDPYTVKGYVDDALADYTTTADLGDLALKDKIEAGDITAGAITNADIAANANIAQSKIDGLTTALAAKADSDDVYTKAEVDSAITEVTGGETGTIAEQIESAIGDLGNKPGTETAYADVKEYIDTEYTKTANLGDLALKDKIEAGDITAGAITNADIAANANIAASKISGLADVATGGDFADLDDVKAAMEYVEIGQVETNDGGAWIWGYVDGEPQFIRVVDKYGN